MCAQYTAILCTILWVGHRCDALRYEAICLFRFELHVLIHAIRIYRFYIFTTDLTNMFICLLIYIYRYFKIYRLILRSMVNSCTCPYAIVSFNFGSSASVCHDTWALSKWQIWQCSRWLNVWVVVSVLCMLIQNQPIQRIYVLAC